jgi:hypothetical protein
MDAISCEMQPEPAVERVRQWLRLCEFGHLRARPNGAHVVLEARGKPIARLTTLGHGAFGVSFPEPNGRWEMLLIDESLDELMANLVDALGE